MSEELTFEETLKQLENVVEQLEHGDSLTLDESLAAFEEGVRLTRLCRKALEEAELRVRRLVEDEESEADRAPTESESEASQGSRAEEASEDEGGIPF
ncbi:MAG: exodeoxyribonuclease VII small subunit [Candidatus Poribacteria bacterium]|nr:exodeoxyribonuclease VII small subunit [Candidatus Poribacteria bacterium]